MVNWWVIFLSLSQLLSPFSSYFLPLLLWGEAVREQHYKVRHLLVKPLHRCSHSVIALAYLFCGGGKKKQTKKPNSLCTVLGLFQAAQEWSKCGVTGTLCFPSWLLLDMCSQWKEQQGKAVMLMGILGELQCKYLPLSRDCEQDQVWPACLMAKMAFFSSGRSLLFWYLQCSFSLWVTGRFSWFLDEASIFLYDSA